MIYLVADGNWLLMNRVFARQRELKSARSDAEKSRILVESLSAAISYWLERVPIYDNLIIVSDHGSWRKELIDSTREENIYKKNRQPSAGFDWDLIWESYDQFLENCRRHQILCPNAWMIEGDDWICAITRALGARGDSCTILSTDKDLTQLVGWSEKSWCAWSNNKPELVLSVGALSAEGTADFFIENSLFSQQGNLRWLDMLRAGSERVSYINPLEVVIKKVLAGDKSDNILPVLGCQKGPRAAYISEKEVSTMITDLELGSLDQLENKIGIIIDYMRNIKRLRGADLEAVPERIAYNKRLVLLDPDLVPQKYKKNVDEFIEKKLLGSKQKPPIKNIIENRNYLAPGPNNFIF